MSAKRIDMENARVDNAVLKDYAETVVTANSGSSYTINISTANVFKITLTANCTFSFSNPFPSGSMCSVTLFLKQDSIGLRTATWPSSVAWPADTAPTLTTFANRTDAIYLFTLNGGASWFGQVIGRFTS
jgi:hypothetical protein